MFKKNGIFGSNGIFSRGIDFITNAPGAIVNAGERLGDVVFSGLGKSEVIQRAEQRGVAFQAGTVGRDLAQTIAGNLPLIIGGILLFLVFRK